MNFGKNNWIWGQRYELSGDGKGLLKYTNSQGDFYHVHSDEMTPLEIFKHAALTFLRDDVQFA